MTYKILITVIQPTATIYKFTIQSFQILQQLTIHKFSTWSFLTLHTNYQSTTSYLQVCCIKLSNTVASHFAKPIFTPCWSILVLEDVVFDTLRGHPITNNNHYVGEGVLSCACFKLISVLRIIFLWQRYTLYCYGAKHKYAIQNISTKVKSSYNNWQKNTYTNIFVFVTVLWVKKG